MPGRTVTVRPLLFARWHLLFVLVELRSALRADVSIGGDLRAAFGAFEGILGIVLGSDALCDLLFGRLDDDERYCRETGFTHPQEYLDLRAKLEELRKQYKSVVLVPCHCDYQPTNLVISGDKLYVLDWEFAGMNDPFYDIACYGNAGFDKALALLECYVGHQPTEDELHRLYFHRAFQCLQWYNVAIFKDRVGLSKDLNMDFNAVALMFLGMAKDLLER